MKAITTKFIGPSNVRGSRYKATAEGGHSVTMSANYALNSEENHDRVAKALRDKMGWKGELVRGGLPDGKGNCYVFLHDYTRVKGSPMKSRTAPDPSNPGWTTAIHLMTDWDAIACRKSPVHQKNIMRSREPEEVTCPKCMKYSPHLNWEWVKNTQADKAESRGNFPLARKLRAQAEQFAKRKAREGSPHHSHDASRLKRGDAVKGAPGTLHARFNGSVEWTRGRSVRVRWADGGTLTGPASAFVKLSRKGSPRHSHRGKRELTIPERHALKVARDTLKMPDAMVGVMGGQNKETARRVIRELTGKEPEGSPRHHPGPLHRAQDLIDRAEAGDPLIANFRDLVSVYRRSWGDNKKSAARQIVKAIEKHPRLVHHLDAFTDLSRVKAHAKQDLTSPKRRSATRPDALGSLVHKAVTKVARALKR